MQLSLQLILEHFYDRKKQPVPFSYYTRSPFTYLIIWKLSNVHFYNLWLKEEVSREKQVIELNENKEIIILNEVRQKKTNTI